MPFASVENLKNYLGKSKNDQDALLEVLIAGVSGHIESYVGEPILEKKVTEYFDIVRWETVTLKFRIISIISATEGSSTVALAETDIVGRKTIRRFSNATPKFLIKWGDQLTVNYRAGNKEVPDDITLATMIQAAYEYKQSTPGGGRVGLFTNAPDTLGESVTYDIKPFVPQVQQILNLYRAP